jgi:steroid delta-isomerase
MPATMAGLPAAVAAFFTGTRAADPDAWVAAFADDAEIHDPVGTPALRGRAELRDRMAGFLPQLARFSGLVPGDAYVCGPSTAVHWHATATTTTGRDLAWSGITTFGLDDRGRIAHLKVWFDPSVLA